MSSFVEIDLKLTENQAKSLLKGKTITISNTALQEQGKPVFVHPTTASKINKAKKTSKGVRFSLTKSEIQHDLDTLQGGSIWSVIRSAPRWISKNWNTIKPVVSGIADLAAPAFGPKGVAVRALVKQTTGVGVGKPVKGSKEAKDKMAAIRAMRGKKTKDSKKIDIGGSFKLN